MYFNVPADLVIQWSKSSGSLASIFTSRKPIVYHITIGFSSGVLRLNILMVTRYTSFSVTVHYWIVDVCPGSQWRSPRQNLVINAPEALEILSACHWYLCGSPRHHGSMDPIWKIRKPILGFFDLSTSHPIAGEKRIVPLSPFSIETC